MITKKLRFTLAAISLFSTVFVTSTNISAAPVRFSQVTQVVDAKPGRANPGNYTRLRLASDPVNDPVNDPKKDGEKSSTRSPQQDDRVITETTYEIEQVGDCRCEDPDRPGRKFPYWALLGLAAIPIVILVRRNGDETPTPPPPPVTPMTPTPTKTKTPTPTEPPPTKTPTPPTEPIPEPMTILLFGTGLAGVGLAARRKFGRREDEEEGAEGEE